LTPLIEAALKEKKQVHEALIACGGDQQKAASRISKSGHEGFAELFRDEPGD